MNSIDTITTGQIIGLAVIISILVGLAEYIKNKLTKK
mgnify:CR=1 FL=1